MKVASVHGGRSALAKGCDHTNENTNLAHSHSSQIALMGAMFKKSCVRAKEKTENTKCSRKMDSQKTNDASMMQFISHVCDLGKVLFLFVSASKLD